MMNTISCFTNHFLIAMPGMDDPNFFQTVTYICEHNETGALGIVINRPTSIKLVEVLEQMEIKIENKLMSETPILYGGPVHQERGFVIHRPCGKWRSSFAPDESINITTSKDILEAMAHNKGPEQVMVSLGYAGWEAGQLEEELTKNLWLCVPADNKIIFDVPFEDRWRAAIASMGIDINSLSSDIGHA